MVKVYHDRKGTFIAKTKKGIDTEKDHSYDLEVAAGSVAESSLTGKQWYGGQTMSVDASMCTLVVIGKSNQEKLNQVLKDGFSGASAAPTKKQTAELELIANETTELPDDQLGKLLDNYRVRGIFARKCENLHPLAGMLLAVDGDIIRHNLAKNKNLSLAVADQLSVDKNFDVLSTLALNDTVPIMVLERLAESKKPSIGACAKSCLKVIKLKRAECI